MVPVFAIVDPKDESVDEVRLEAGRVEGSGISGKEKTEEGVEGGAGGSGTGIGVALLVGGRVPELAWLLVLDGGWGFEGRGGSNEGRMEGTVAGV